MSTDVVKYAFIAGEISPTLFGRTDLTKYDLAMAEAKNFFVDYRGGLSSRPGFRFCEPVGLDNYPTRMVPFNFSTDLSNSYIIVFGHNYVRFIQDGGYIYKIPVPILAIDDGVVTAPGHGVVEGGLVKFGGVPWLRDRTFEAHQVTADTYKIYTLPGGAEFITGNYPPYTDGGYAYCVYEVYSPYTGADLANLDFKQYRDIVRITSPDYPIRTLTRSDHTDWAFNDEDISPYHEGPEITSATASATGSAQVVWGVTAIFADGSESVLGPRYLQSGVVNYVATEGSVSIAWAQDPDAVYYNVYRSIVASGQDLNEGADLGYVGRTYGTKFTDPNIIPDFTRVPPTNYNPFAPGAIEKITVTAGGTGYPPFGTTVTINDFYGSGFDGQVITNDDGEVVNVVIKNGGFGYRDPTVSFSSGTGAEGTVEFRPLTGTYPAVSALFQQRQVYGASYNAPITVWGSRIKQFSNFSSSDLILEDDAFEHTLDTAAVAPIKHLLPTRGGLLLITQESIWQLSGGNNGPITPTNALADPQSYNGASALRPITIGSDLLFYEGKGHAVQMLSYNEISRVYASEDKSLLSNHLFGAGKDLVAWAYQESPYKVVWAVREDGALLAFTTVRAEEVFAWTPCTTQGKFVDIAVVREGTEDRVYATTQRLIAGRLRKFIERMDLRQFVNVEDAWCVDCGLSLENLAPAGFISIFNTDGDWSVSGEGVAFSTDDIGKVLRAANGIFTVTEFLSEQSLALELITPPTNFIPETNDSVTFPIQQGSWTLDMPVTYLRGLSHLEGMEVSILGDGNVFPKQTVVDGGITLSTPVSRAIVGLSFECRAKTLPIIMPGAVIESRRKRVVGIGVRLDKSRGLSIGPELARLYPMKDRTNEAPGLPTRLRNGMTYQLLATDWNEEGQTFFSLTDPLPVNILSIVSDIEVGDEPD